MNVKNSLFSNEATTIHVHGFSQKGKIKIIK